ncbi:MAG: Glutamyl-Q tRNA(Asp) synthetase, partial [uncultured Gemmatimonadetes bacterium]
DPRTLCPQPHRRAARRQRAHGAHRVAARTCHWRRLRDARGRPGFRARAARVHGAAAGRIALAGAGLGRGARRGRPSRAVHPVAAAGAVRGRAPPPGRAGAAVRVLLLPPRHCRGGQRAARGRRGPALLRGLPASPREPLRPFADHARPLALRPADARRRGRGGVRRPADGPLRLRSRRGGRFRRAAKGWCGGLPGGRRGGRWGDAHHPRRARRGPAVVHGAADPAVSRPRSPGPGLPARSADAGGRRRAPGQAARRRVAGRAARCGRACRRGHRLARLHLRPGGAGRAHLRPRLGYAIRCRPAPARAHDRDRGGGGAAAGGV